MLNVLVRKKKKQMPIYHLCEATAIIRILFSRFYAIDINDFGFFFLGTGVQYNAENVIILSHSNSSIVNAPKNAFFFLYAF